MAETVTIGATASAGLHGRLPVRTKRAAVTPANVVEVLKEALPAFAVNAAQISYLWNYYKGVQPILDRVKEVRPEINNKVVVNVAQEIVAFKIGYQLAEPLQYTGRLQDDEAAYDRALAGVNELNTLMFAEDKASGDRDLFEWMSVGGTGFRMAIRAARDDGAPFDIYALDPRSTCVVETSDYRHEPVMAFMVGRDPDTGGAVYDVYTRDMWYLVRDDEVVDSSPHTYGSLPIVEYRLNNARMGVFEPVLSLLDAINNVESNRLDDIEQTVQALLKFVNCDVDEAEFESMLKLGAVKVRTVDPQLKADIDSIVTDLDQTGVQMAKDDLYQAVVNICGMPNRNGTKGSSSDTGAAVLLRDGWTLAESHAKSYELQFKRAEREFLRVVLAICDQKSGVDLGLRIRDIELAFNRRNYENILVKAQVLTTMLQTDKIHPQLAFQSCGLFTDPDAAYRQSVEYMEEHGAGFGEAALAVAAGQAVRAGSQAGSPEPSGETAA